MDEKTLHPEKLVYKGYIELEMAGINIGKAGVHVYEGSPLTGPSADLNPFIYIVKAEYNEVKYVLSSNKGGIDAAIESMREHISNELKKKGK